MLGKTCISSSSSGKDRTGARNSGSRTSRSVPVRGQPCGGRPALQVVHPLLVRRCANGQGLPRRHRTYSRSLDGMSITRDPRTLRPYGGARERRCSMAGKLLLDVLAADTEQPCRCGVIQVRPFTSSSRTGFRSSPGRSARDGDVSGGAR